MLKHLRHRETGILGEKSPVLFETIEMDRRLTALDLAKYKDFESVHKTPVVCGNLDPTECRYFISGTRNDGYWVAGELYDCPSVMRFLTTTELNNSVEDYESLSGVCPQI